MMVLRSGHLFYELRLLVEFSEISFTLIHVSYLGNIFVLSTVSPGLMLIWLQKNAPDCKIWKLIFVVVIASN